MIPAAKSQWDTSVPSRRTPATIVNMEFEPHSSFLSPVTRFVFSLWPIRLVLGATAMSRGITTRSHERAFFHLALSSILVPLAPYHASHPSSPPCFSSTLTFSSPHVLFSSRLSSTSETIWGRKGLDPAQNDPHEVADALLNQRGDPTTRNGRPRHSPTGS